MLSLLDALMGKKKRKNRGGRSGSKNRSSSPLIRPNQRQNKSNLIIIEGGRKKRGRKLNKSSVEDVNKIGEDVFGSRYYCIGDKIEQSE